MPKRLEAFDRAALKRVEKVRPKSRQALHDALRGSTKSGRRRKEPKPPSDEAVAKFCAGLLESLARTVEQFETVNAPPPLAPVKSAKSKKAGAQKKRGRVLGQLYTCTQRLQKQLDTLSAEIKVSLELEMQGQKVFRKDHAPRPTLDELERLLGRLGHAIPPTKADPRRTGAYTFGRTIFGAAVRTWRQLHTERPTIDGFDRDSPSWPSPLCVAVSQCVRQMTDNPALQVQLTGYVYIAIVNKTR